MALILVVGSIAEIQAQSSGYRSATNTGYGALASRVADASNQTAAQLASVIDSVPHLTNQALPFTARAVLQQGLDGAVAATAQEADQAAHLVPPYPSDNVSDQFTRVMQSRAAGTSQLRTSIDRLLGMTPLPIAGAPVTSTVSGSAPLISIGQASASMGHAGMVFQQSDADYRAIRGQVSRQRLPIRLPRSVWVPVPIDSASLGSTRLAGAASALGNSADLAPYHRLAITAIGLRPPAVSTGGPGLLGASCATVTSTGPGSAPTLLPPTATVTTEVTVTNCGTVPESGVQVSQTLALADPAGTPLPPSDARGSASRAMVSLQSGSSVALTLPPLTVASGHTYTLTVAVATPANQQDRAGSTQQFLVQISG